MDTRSFGIIILDADGKMLEANAVAQEHFRADHGIARTPEGTLSLRRPAGPQLSRWIATGLPPERAADSLLRIPRQHALPISVVVTCVPARATSWIAGDPRWLILIFDPERRVQASIDLIARDLGISAREAEVAGLLVSGFNLREVAVRLRLSKHNRSRAVEGRLSED